MFPARLGIAKSSMQLGYNRLLLRKDGLARAVFDNLDRFPYGPVDPNSCCSVWRTRRDRRRHCSFTTRRTPSARPDELSVFGGLSGCAPVSGGAGAQRHASHVRPGRRRGYQSSVSGPLRHGRTGFRGHGEDGAAAGSRVLRVYKTVKPLAPATEPIRVRSEVLTFPERWEKDKTMEVGITTILLGRQLAIATIPGEPFHKLQKTWKELADVPHPLFTATRGARAGRGPATFRICIQPHTAATARMPARASRSARERRHASPSDDPLRSPGHVEGQAGPALTLSSLECGPLASRGRRGHVQPRFAQPVNQALDVVQLPPLLQVAS